IVPSTVLRKSTLRPNWILFLVDYKIPNIDTNPTLKRCAVDLINKLPNVNLIEKVCNYSILGCDNLEEVIIRFEDMADLDFENVLYYWTEYVHKKWIDMLDGPYLAMRQPDDYDPEETWRHRDDPVCHDIRCRGINLHCWTIQTHLTKLMFTHLLNNVHAEDFEEMITLFEEKPKVWFKFYYKTVKTVTIRVCSDCVNDLLGEDIDLVDCPEEPTYTLEAIEVQSKNGSGKEHLHERCSREHDNDDGTGNTIQPEVVGGSTDVSLQSLEDQASQHLRLRAIKTLNPELYNSIKEELLDIFREPLGLLLGTPFSPTRRYVSDVLILGDRKERRSILQWIKGNGIDYPGNLYGYVEEETHVHVIHDCAYSNRSCRCRWRNHPGVRAAIKKPIRRPKYIRQFDWLYVILYFYLSKRGGEKEIWINGRIRRLPGQLEDLRWKALCQRAQDVLEGQGEGVFNHAESEESLHEGNKQAVHQCVRGSSKKGGRFEELCSLTQLLLSKYLCIPLTDVRKIILPSNADHNLKLHDPVNERHYLAACKLFSQTINSYTLLELKELLDKTQPVFYSNSATNPFKYYHDRKTSFTFLLDLLKFQCNDDEDKFRDLLYNIKNWFNKKGWYQIDNNEYKLNNKINTIAVIGPPNAGKNYFWDCFAAIALNVGHIGRVNNKTNQFALQEVIDKRLIVGNEINMEEGAKDDFKKLCEGKALNVRVKHCPDGIYYRTPVLLLSNNNLDICNDPTFKDVRLKVFYWRKCELLKKSDKQPYPMAVFDLYSYFNVSLV
ncbi:initiator protein NS1, partial [Trichonephila inaurata madagascariensis]